MLDIKKFYLFLRRNGKKSQTKLQTQIKLKAAEDVHYSEFEHGYARGLAEAYMNVARWIKECQKEDSHE